MSRWSLIKSSFTSKNHNKSEKSIHKFQGYQIYQEKSKIIWKGFIFDYILSGIEINDDLCFEKFYNQCISWINEVDSSEVMINLYYINNESIFDTNESIHNILKTFLHQILENQNFIETFHIKIHDFSEKSCLT